MWRMARNGAKNKHIPQWVLDLKTEYLEYLLMGILESDGCYSQNRYKVTTISRDLAYNIGELVLKVKNVPYHIYKTIRPTTHKIEERIVNQNNTYQITWSNIYNKNINFIDDFVLTAIFLGIAFLIYIIHEIIKERKIRKRK